MIIIMLVISNSFQRLFEAGKQRCYIKVLSVNKITVLVQVLIKYQYMMITIEMLQLSADRKSQRESKPKESKDTYILI